MRKKNRLHRQKRDHALHEDALKRKMEEYSEQLGQKVREEAESLFARGDLIIPAELDRICLALIEQRAEPKESGK